MSTSDNRCPMLEAWEAEIQQLWNSDTSCTGNNVHTRVPGFDVWIVTTGERVYVAKKLSKYLAIEESRYLEILAPHPGINVLIGVTPGMGLSDWILKVKYCKHGSLYCYLKTKPHPDNVSTHLLPWIQQLLRALVHMHAKGVVHCDIKSHNIFIEDPEHVVIGDFGLAQNADSDGKCQDGCGGTQDFWAPEDYFAQQDDDERPLPTDLFDVWGLGCVVHELMYGLRKGNDAFWPIAELVRKGLLNRSDDVSVKPEHARCRKIATAVRAQALEMLPQNRPRAQALLNKLDSLIAQELPVKRKLEEIESPDA